jgi:N-acyl-D-aspartate/D-glutamate deacylase
MTSYDIVIKNGCIVDGTGVPRQFGDIAVKDGRITRISSEITAPAARIIDAKGRIVAPGVIDPHTHYDAQVHWDPYCTNSSWHGNTTVVVSNCGFGFAPCKPADRDRYMLMMENTEQVPVGAMRAALGWEWESFPEWMAHMKRVRKGVNMASYFPLNSLMIYVMGYEGAKTRGATPGERARMKELLNEAMDAGAIGFSLSNLNVFNSHKDIDGTPMPTDEMFLEDAYALAEVLRERDQGVIQCLAEIPGVVANRHVVEALAAASKRPVLHNVVTAFDLMPEAHRGVLDWLDGCDAKGLNIYSQAFSFRAWNEFNVVDFNAWQYVPMFNTFSLAQGQEGKAALARDEAFLARARSEYDPAQMTQAGGPLETLRLHRTNGAESYAGQQGRLIGDIAAGMGRPVTDVFFEIVALSGASADFRTSEAVSVDPEKISEILRNKRVIPGTSDGGAHVKFHSGGQYASDLITWMVRDQKRFSLEEMHFKLSYLPARILGLDGRGALCEGNFADLYIYDFDALTFDHGNYEVVHDLPGGDWRRVSRASGVDWVVVNGEPIFKNGVDTGAMPGRMIGNGGPDTDAKLAPAFSIAAE